MKRLLLFSLALLAPASCSGSTPTLERSGVLQPGGTLQVVNLRGDVNAYAPERGAALYRYQIAAFASEAAAVRVTARPLLVRAAASAPGVRFLIRAPKGSSLDITTGTGNIGVADFDGIVNAHTDRGDIKMLIPSYGNASAGTGNVSVIFGADTWPGTLHFSTMRGNVEVYVNEHAKARIRMHTGDGTVFSDFNLTGTSTGSTETIDAPINGGGPRAIDIEVRHGSIRVMQLKPQL